MRFNDILNKVIGKAKLKIEEGIAPDFNKDDEGTQEKKLLEKDGEYKIVYINSQGNQQEKVYGNIESASVELDRLAGLKTSAKLYVNGELKKSCEYNTPTDKYIIVDEAKDEKKDSIHNLVKSIKDVVEEAKFDGNFSGEDRYDTIHDIVARILDDSKLRFIINDKSFKDELRKQGLGYFWNYFKQGMENEEPNDVREAKKIGDIFNAADILPKGWANKGWKELGAIGRPGYKIVSPNGEVYQHVDNFGSKLELIDIRESEESDLLRKAYEALKHLSWCRVCSEGDWKNCEGGRKALEVINKYEKDGKGEEKAEQIAAATAIKQLGKSGSIKKEHRRKSSEAIGDPGETLKIIKQMDGYFVLMDYYGNSLGGNKDPDVLEKFAKENGYNVRREFK